VRKIVARFDINLSIPQRTSRGPFGVAAAQRPLWSGQPYLY